MLQGTVPGAEEATGSNGTLAGAQEFLKGKQEMIIETREFELRIEVGTFCVLVGLFLMVVHLFFNKQAFRFYDWHMRHQLPGMWTGKVTRGARLVQRWVPALLGLGALVWGILILCSLT